MTIERLWEYKDIFLVFLQNFHPKIWRATFEVHLKSKLKNKSYRAEKIVKKGEIDCYKQYLLFSQCFPQLYILNVLICGIVW